MNCRLKHVLALFVFIQGPFACVQNLQAQVETNPPVVTILASDPNASEIGPDTGAFTISRSGPTNDNLTVFYGVGGTAQPGVDYQPLAGHVTIPAGTLSADITVTPIADVDTTFETNETVEVRLVRPFLRTNDPSGPVPWPPPYLVGSPSNAVVNIAESGLVTNPPPHVRIVSPLNGSIFLEPANITIVAHAEDSHGKVETVEFFSGTNSLGVKTNQPVANPLGPFVLFWSNVVAGEYSLTAKATDGQGVSSVSALVNIKVLHFPNTNPPPVVTIVASDPDASEIGPDTGTFTVTRTDGTNSDLTVFYHVGGTAKPGRDYQALSGHLTIPAGASSADITLTPIADVDTTIETNETVEVRLVPPILPLDDPDGPVLWPPPYVVGFPSNAIVNIAEAVVLTNLPPYVRIVSPLNGAKFAAPANIVLIAHAEDIDDQVATVEFFAGTDSLGIKTNLPVANLIGPFVLTWSNVLAGDYTLTAKATDSRGASAVSDPITIHVLEVPPPPVVTVVASDPDATEIPEVPPWLGMLQMSDPAVFTVRRTGSTAPPLVVFYRVGGTAENGVDYDRLAGRVMIPSGAESAQISVFPIDDGLVEGTETVELTLVPPREFPDAYQTGSPGSATALIHDNDEKPDVPPGVKIVSPSDGAVFVAPASVKVSARAEDSDGWVRFVEFFAGDHRLGVAGVLMPDIPFELTWSNAPPGDYKLTAKATDNVGATGVSDPVTIHVTGTPPPVVTVVASDPDASEIGPDTGTFTVSRTGPTNSELNVFFHVGGTAKPGVDYKALSGHVTIPAGTSSTDITVTPIPDVDTTVETNETVEVRLVPPILPRDDPSGPIPWPLPYVLGFPSNAVVNIAESGLITNPPPHVRIVSPENGRKFVAPANIQIVARAEDTNDRVSTVEFFEGTNSLGVTTNRAAMNPLGPFVLVWSNVVAGEYHLTAKATDDQGATSLSALVNISVVTNLPPPTNALPVVIIYARDPVAFEGTNSMGDTNVATFVVRRSDGTNNDLTIYYAIGDTASNGVDYVKLPGTVTIPAGGRSAKITVVPLEDNDHELLNTVVLKLTPPPTAVVPTYTIGHPGKAAAIIVDRGEFAAEGDHSPDGLFHFRLPGMNGFFFRVEASDDLVTWTPVCTNVVTEGAIHFVDPDATEHPHRFYHVVPEADSDTDD